jgi:hypothetical protein
MRRDNVAKAPFEFFWGTAFEVSTVKWRFKGGAKTFMPVNVCFTLCFYRKSAFTPPPPLNCRHHIFICREIIMGA